MRKRIYYHVQSPVLNINRACQTCHRWPEEELKAPVETIQERVFNVRNIAMDTLVELIEDIKTAKNLGRTEDQLKSARSFQRKAQFFLDFVEAENSTGFHAPEEAKRILAESINNSRKGQVSLRELKWRMFQFTQHVVRGGATRPPGYFRFSNRQ